jgi:hypothetical protein
MSSIDDFVADLKLQSKRDLDSAKIILKQNGPIEHVAWFCEQSFKKTIKYVYAYYKLKIQEGTLDSVYDKMKEKSHLSSTELIINMRRQFYSESWQFLEQHLSSDPSVPEPVTTVLKEMFRQSKIYGAGFFDKMFDDAIRRMGVALKNKEEYLAFLQRTSEEQLRRSLSSVNFDKIILEATELLNTSFRSLLTPRQVEDAGPFMSSSLQVKQLRFILKVIALCSGGSPLCRNVSVPSEGMQLCKSQVFQRDGFSA